MSRGFTLLEILVVLGILGLSLTIVTPMIDNALKSSQIKSAAHELVTGLRTTRNLAIVSQKETTLNIDVEKRLYRIDSKDKQLELPESTELTLTTARSEQSTESAGQIRFFPDGSSTGGQISLSANNQHYVVVVNWLTGQVSINE